VAEVLHTHVYKGRTKSPGEVSAAEKKAEVSAAFIRAKTRAAESRAKLTDLELARKQGLLIERSQAVFEASCLMFNFRAHVMAMPAAVVRDMVRAGYVALEHQHATERLLVEALGGLLHELAGLPKRLSANGDGDEKANHGSHSSRRKKAKRKSTADLKAKA
jgi:hypothetical protein